MNLNDVKVLFVNHFNVNGRKGMRDVYLISEIFIDSSDDFKDVDVFFFHVSFSNFKINKIVNHYY